VPALKLSVEGLRQTRTGGATKNGFVVIGVYRIRPGRVTPHFRMLEFAARYVMLHDPEAEDAAPDEDGGGAAPAGGVVLATTRDVQAGVNYYVNRNVRLMANLIVPTDARRTPSGTLLTRLQIVF
jgi:hypothetical protein